MFKLAGSVDPVEVSKTVPSSSMNSGDSEPQRSHTLKHVNHKLIESESECMQKCSWEKGSRTLKYTRFEERLHKVSMWVSVVGGGFAGLLAAITALQHSEVVRVLIVEKESRLGGNSAKASSGMNAVHDAVGDSVDAFVRDTMRGSDHTGSETLVSFMAEHSAESKAILESLGISLDMYSQCGGHSFPRTWRNSGPGNVGWYIMKTLEDYLKTFGDRVSICTECTLSGLRIVDGRCHGIEYLKDQELVSFDSDAVILATGGFSSNVFQVALQFDAEIDPRLRSLPTTNGDFARGDGLFIAQKNEIDVIDIDKIQVHPTAFVDPHDVESTAKILAAESLRAYGAILIDSSGKRFVNELERRDKVFEQIDIHKSTKPSRHVWMLLGPRGKEKFGPGFSFYEKKGLFKLFPSFDEFSRTAPIPVDQLSETILNYNLAASGEKPDEFGKKIFPESFIYDGPVYVAMVTPAIHYTMGGIRIDEQARVYSTTGTIIPGLFAAGEVTGGIHGKNRLAGNSLLECAVYGRVAALNALDYATRTI